MMRALTILLASSCAFALGTWCALVACENHARARELDRLQRRWEELRSLRSRLLLEAEAHVPGEAGAPLLESGLPPLPGDGVEPVGTLLVEVSQ